MLNNYLNYLESLLFKQGFNYKTKFYNDDNDNNIYCIGQVFIIVLIQINKPFWQL